MGFFDAGVVGIKRIFHSVNPVIVIIMPTIGSKGINGHRIISIKLKIPPKIIIRVPAMSRKRREKKPIMRETSLSKNIWNLMSREAEPEAAPAEICR